VTETRRHIPAEILAAAHDRARARAERDWPEADRLRGVIEAAGWKIVDRGTDFGLSPAAAPTVQADGVVRFGASRDVPSRFDEPATRLATVILVATDWPADLERTMQALESQEPTDIGIVIVADGASADQEAALANVATNPQHVEIVRTAERLGQAGALNVGFRRATGPVVVILDTSVEPTGPIVERLAAVLDDPTVGVAGGWGIVSDDLRRFRDAPPGDVDAIEGYAMAFRREDVSLRGPLDERFRFYRNLDIWWSLVLRDQGEDTPPRRAVSIELPAIRHEHRGWASVDDAERQRLSRRNFYRIIDRFGWRRDLARPPVSVE
jgi:GT2 family glycosyltransferase